MKSKNKIQLKSCPPQSLSYHPSPRSHHLESTCSLQVLCQVLVFPARKPVVKQCRAVVLMCASPVSPGVILCKMGVIKVQSFTTLQGCSEGYIKWHPQGQLSTHSWHQANDYHSQSSWGPKKRVSLISLAASKC